ncbi:MAG: hypothetical protein ABF893_07690, partial [Gluconacetobacter liquefaciens]
RMAAAFDAPFRQTFVAERMGNADLDNAVSLNSTSFNTARIIRPHDEDRDRGNRHRLGLPDQ